MAQNVQIFGRDYDDGGARIAIRTNDEGHLFTNIANTANISTNDTTTHDKLDTLNATCIITNTNLEDVESAINNKVLNKDTSSIDITNQNINVNPTVEGSSYDLILQGAQLWADTTPVVNPFFVDTLGREGWYYSNLGNAANLSNVYWYANPTAGNLQENDMTFSQLSGFYCVLTCDYVENGALTIPIFAVYSQATGSNDIIPTFCHSRWSYVVSSVDRAKFRKGETVLLYSGASRPDVFNQLPAYNLVLASANGDALPSEIVAYMSVNTQATTSTIGYLLQYVGYLNSAVGYNKQYGFKNSKDRLAQENLASLTVVGGVLSVSGGGGGGGNVTVDNIADTPLISGYALDSTLSAVNTSIIDKHLNQTVDSVTVNVISGFATDATLVSTNEKLDTINDSIVNKTLNKTTSSIDISGQTLNVNTISGFALNSTVLTSNNTLSTINDSIVETNTKLVTTNVLLNTINATTLASTNSKLDTINESIVNKTLNKTTSSIDVSGQTLNVNTISGFALDSTVVTSNNKLTTIAETVADTNNKVEITNSLLGNINGSIVDKHLNSNLDSVTVNVISGFATNSTLVTTNDKLETINNTILTKTLNKTTSSVDINGQTVNVNTISGFAVETGGNLASIKANTDKNTYTNNSLNTNITNTSLPVTGTFFQTTQPVSGTVTVSTLPAINITNTGFNVNNQITGFATESTLGAIKTQTDKLAFNGSNDLKTVITNSVLTVETGTNSLKTNITNSSIDVHNKIFHNGNWINLVGANNGHLLVNSSTQDGDGNDITSTVSGEGVGAKLGLDTASEMFALSGLNRTRLTCDSNGYLNTFSNLRDGAGIDLTATDTTSTQNSLDTASCLYTTDSSARSALTSTAISTKRALDVNVANTTAIQVNDTTGNTTLSTINGKLLSTTNDGGITGINVYQIYPKKLVYTLTGSSSTLVQGQFLGPEAAALENSVSNFLIGRQFPRAFNIFLTGFSPPGGRFIDIDYINSLGNLDYLYNANISTNSTAQILTGAVNINRIAFNPDVTESVGGTLVARDTFHASGTINRYALNSNNSGSGVITCPNGYVGFINNLYYNAALPDDLQMIIKDKRNNVVRTRTFYGINTAATNGKYQNIGDINEGIYAGESVYFSGFNTNVGQRYVHASVILTAV